MKLDYWTRHRYTQRWKQIEAAQIHSSYVVSKINHNAPIYQLKTFKNSTAVLTKKYPHLYVIITNSLIYSHSFGEQFSQKKWTREIAGQREILAAYGGVKLSDVRGMRAPFLSVGGNKMYKMLYDSNFTYDSSMPVYENRPPSWPYTLDRIFV